MLSQDSLSAWQHHNINLLSQGLPSNLPLLALVAERGLCKQHKEFLFRSQTMLVGEVLALTLHRLSSSSGPQYLMWGWNPSVTVVVRPTQPTDQLRDVGVMAVLTTCVKGPRFRWY